MIVNGVAFGCFVVRKMCTASGHFCADGFPQIGNNQGFLWQQNHSLRQQQQQR